jgi:predicted RNase H-like HicB family nuclease
VGERLNLQREGPQAKPYQVRQVRKTGNLQIVMNSGNYEMIIWWSNDDAAYVVEVPELPGCMAHGKTRPESIRQAEAAIRLWIKTAKEDGLEIPQPRGRLVYA